jgi:hypothetical protein
MTCNGAYVSLASLTTTPPDPVHGGRQSMWYDYDNGDSQASEYDYYSEAFLDFYGVGQDWTDCNMVILTLFFYGDPNNDANQQMYAGLEDTRGAASYAEVKYGYYPDEDMNDITYPEWFEWNIALEDFNQPNAVWPTDVNRLYIGFGIRGNEYTGEFTDGNTGTVYFDNIRLYQQKCIAPRLKPLGDFTDDCRVDMRDVEELGEQWVRSDIEFDAIDPPDGNDDPNFVLWYKLEGGYPGTAYDSGYLGYFHGEISGRTLFVQGKDGVGLEFLEPRKREKEARIYVPDEALNPNPELRPLEEVSVTAWIYFEEGHGDARIVVKGNSGKEAYKLEVDDDDVSFAIRDANQGYKNYDVDGTVYEKEWLHLAGTYDRRHVKLYVNGALQSPKKTTDVNDAILGQAFGGFAVGNKADKTPDQQFEGIVDDVRLYDSALSAAQVAYLAGEGTMSVPLPTVQTHPDSRNIYYTEPQGVKQAINLKDFALLIENWRKKKLLWPPK